MTIIHSFAACLDNNGQIDAIFLDFKKAFDKVPHDKLIAKLKNIHIPDIFVSWIAAYLSNRQQLVKINEEESRCLPVTSGVPQGSVLGPLLFLLYINDLVTVVDPTVQIRLFADDCVLFREVTCTNDQNELEKNIENVREWCVEWGMELNLEKSVYLCVTRKKNPSEHVYKLGSSSLTQVDSYKYLGVTLTNNLSWNMHIDNICSSAFRKLCFLRYKLRNSPPNVKLLSYFTFVRPKLEYASIVWDPHTKQNVKKLERIQRKAIRFVYSRFLRTDSPTDLMLANNIPSLQDRRKKSRLDFLSLLYNRKLSLDPTPFLSPLNTRPTRHRQPNALTPYFARTDTFKFSFFPRTISDWNQTIECSTCDTE